MARAVAALTAVVALAFAVLAGTGRFAPTPALAAGGDREVPTASGARLGGDQRRTRFVLDLSSAVGFSVFVLDEPFRVIVDLPEVRFDLPPGLGKTGRGLVSAYRYGLFSPGKSRVVIDTVAPVLIQKSFVLKADHGQPARLVVDLMRTDRATFERMQTERQQAAARLARQLGAQRARDKLATDRRKRNGRPTVIIDPGHGGVDPGAIGRSGLTEKRVVLAFSRVLYRMLKATGRYNVHLTRSDDSFLRLRERVRIAREREADLFIAVHADSAPHRGARGATVYTLSERASDREAAALAAKENRSDIIAGVELEEESDEVLGILIDLAQRETKNHSIYFAKLLVKQLKTKTRLTGLPHRFAGFRVLTAPDVPSVLLELGYISNRREEKLLKSPAWQKQTAKTVVAAVKSYFSARIAGAGTQ